MAAIDKDAQRLADRLSIRTEQAAAAVGLLDAGNTVPFIARYRKEMTGGLDDEQLRTLADELTALRALDERRAAIIGSIDEQGKLTPELRRQLDVAQSRTALEDLYAPYRPKRRTRAGLARGAGLQPLADLIIAQALGADPPAMIAMAYLSEAVATVEAALAGARDIVAETISDQTEVRRVTRQRALQWGQLRSEKIEKAEDARGVYQTYYAFTAPVSRLRAYQVLALNRGETEKILRLTIEVPEREWREVVERAFPVNRRSTLADELRLAIDDAAERLLLPAIERDVRSHLTEMAEQHAIRVFAANLAGLLTQPPLADQTVLGIDPGFRTGCKVAVVDATGKLLETATIYPHEPQRRWSEALAVLRQLVERYAVTLVAIGNGTASRETEQLAADLIRHAGQTRPADATSTGGMARGAGRSAEAGGAERDAPHYLMVSEAGASVYSASALARAELPGLDVSLRGAVSIARRAQEPLAELIKIDPRSIGVGLYQHDVDQRRLSEALGGVVERVVNRVGVDLNTASPSLLTHIAGIGPTLAERIVADRNTNGAFPNRRALLRVKGLGPRAFEQAAGFLRVYSGDMPLDASAIHPESYKIAQALLARAGLNLATPPAEREPALAGLVTRQALADLAVELGAGEPTLADIHEQLIRPGRDPRADLPPPILRQDVLSIDDLKPGLRLKGTVRNVVDFGAFVDIGVKQDGLLHRSQMPHGTVVGVGDVIEIAILRLEHDRGRIALTWPTAEAIPTDT